MNKILSLLVFLVGCSSANSQSCDLCGKWSFERFEYVGHITTDCEDTASHFYKNSYIEIDKNSFAYYTYDTQNEIKDTHIIFGEYDYDENAQEFFIKSGDKTIETFYKSAPNTIYLLSDGCRFYFKKN